ncbi:PEP/pyruvate-binding domain-containing protein [Phytohabitans suffuscus]|uniref:Phosphoenolpyruvate synthase n=1 Tax=Phytohabitans suffuscus TaxID=624315 RepID=A0A6F8YU95_9ACTN|nr:PEP/pyruvate-binding domain-containing protein [Phytohabitans suffuscus]BCB89508.1 phosphoenolpyruvate synthase [Phytohabitans suffuscus]
MSGLAVPLDRPAAPGEVGGKLSALAGLRRAGFAVPAGYAVTVAAFRCQLAATGLQELADRVVAALRRDSDRTGDEVGLELAARLRQALATAPVAGPVRDAIAAAHRRLRAGRADPPVAVRSSAVDEDGAAASFAGVFDTVLGVRGTGAVVEAVRECWAGLYAPRALAYRRRRAADLPMAVGVQELVPARCSGVAFSAHPVTGRRDRVVIEANWGWGEAVVQGSVTPDHVEVDTGTGVAGRVVRHVVAHKAVMSGPDPDGGRIRTVPVPAALADRPVLDEAQIMEIATTVRRVERHTGRPVDVEWVLDGARPARLWIVQARPITA